MKVKQWGESIWEEKINVQNESGVIGGSRISSSKMKERTNKNIMFLDKFFLRNLKKGSVLDCGMGPCADYSIFFAKKGFDVTGVDISKTTLKYAERYIKEAKVKVKLIQDNFIDFKNTPRTYDLVFCTGVFLHIPSYLALKTLKQFNKKTKKGKYCLIQFVIDKEKTVGQIFFNFYYQLAHKIKGFFMKTFNVNCSAYTREEIKDMCKRTGFEIISTKNNYYLLKKK